MSNKNIFFDFLKINYNSSDGKKLINCYNITKYPFVAILDPRTGDKLMSFTGIRIDLITFCARVTNFLADFNMPIKDFEASK